MLHTKAPCRLAYWLALLYFSVFNHILLILPQTIYSYFIFYAEKLSKQFGFCRPSCDRSDDSNNQKNSKSRYICCCWGFFVLDQGSTSTQFDFQLKEIIDDWEEPWWYDSFQVVEEGLRFHWFLVWWIGGQWYIIANCIEGGLHKQVEIFGAVDRIFWSSLCLGICECE